MDSKIDGKLDKIQESISRIDVTLAKQSVILDEHVKRSTMLEAKMEPIEKHVTIANAALKILGVLAGLGGGAHGVMHYIMKLY